MSTIEENVKIACTDHNFFHLWGYICYLDDELTEENWKDLEGQENFNTIEDVKEFIKVEGSNLLRCLDSCGHFEERY